MSIFKDKRPFSIETPDGSYSMDDNMIMTFNASEPVSFTFTMDNEAHESFLKFMEEHPEYFTFDNPEEQ